MDEIGLVTRDDDEEDMIRLRANLLALDYFARDKKRFARLAEMYDNDYSKMDKEVRGDILCAKAYLQPEVIDDYLKKYKDVADPDVKFDYLEAACLTRDAAQVKKMLGLLGKYDIVKSQDQLYLFVYLYRNPKARAGAFKWLTENWELVKKTGGEKTLSDYPMLIGRIARTQDELELYKKFFEPMLGDAAVTRAITIGLKEIEARVRLIAENGDAVAKAVQEVV